MENPVSLQINMVFTINAHRGSQRKQVNCLKSENTFLICVPCSGTRRNCDCLNLPLLKLLYICSSTLHCHQILTQVLIRCCAMALQGYQLLMHSVVFNLKPDIYFRQKLNLPLMLCCSFIYSNHVLSTCIIHLAEQSHR